MEKIELRGKTLYPETLLDWLETQTQELGEKAAEELDKTLAFCKAHENSKGLLNRINLCSHDNFDGYIIDSPLEICNNYDYENAESGVCTVLNMFYYGTLKHGAALFAFLGLDERAEHLRDKCARLESAIIDSLYDSKLGLFKDADFSEHYSLHANALALTFGIKPKAGYELLVSYVKQKRFKCGDYFARFVAIGLENIGESAMAAEVRRKITGDIKWENCI